MKPLKIGNLTAQIPVVQGGMGVGVSLSGLAGAVAACGGVGIISTAQIGYREPDWDEHPLEANLRAIGQEIEKARNIAGGNGIIGCNIMVATRDYEQYVKAAVAAKADLIISGAGLPVDLPRMVMGSSTKIMPIVSSLKSAQVICRYWEKRYGCYPDGIVIEGPLAGGHLGFSMEQLENVEDLDYDNQIKEIIAYIDSFGKKARREIPVIVAGGIYDKADMDHALELGAAGVQVATRFVTTYECDAADAYKQAYIDAQKEDIVLVKSPVGMPGRAILNSFMKRAKEEKIPHGKCHLCISTCNPAETPYCITEGLIHAVTGDVEHALLFCGENAYRAEKIEYVKDIMKEFAE
jgi:NAD(P)H-dependent flavin oxidoreductase YrpB (nitropropane dioxygenase family)